MERSRNFKSLAKSGAARTLAMVATVLLVFEPFALALDYKYPTSYTITPVSMGDGMTLEQGVIFGFNSAKSMADADAYADLQEAACKTPATNFTFGTGMEGFSTVAGTALSYNYSGSEGNLAAGAINTRLSRRNGSSNFQWNKSFFWDCGTPGATSFSLYYKQGTWTSAGVTNNFQVNIVKPDTSVVNIVASTNITASNWTQVSGTVPAGTFNLPGSYTLRINGTLSGTSNANANVIVHFDDVNLTVTSGYAGFKQETELTIRATPYSSLASNQYLLDIRARKNAADTENTYIQVFNGATWTTRYTVSSTSWTTFNTYYLTTAEYNGGNVRIRYVDADQSAGDTTQGGVQVEYQRVGVDQGVCVDQVTDQEADCGKCHNYGGDITKPWPNTGMHNKHAQTESTSDCLWCHPNNGVDSAHRNGIQAGYAIELAGTKIYRAGGANPQGAAGSYDSATKRCSTVDCHKGIQTPAWDSVYGTNIERNCSRCHNSGAPGADNPANLNLSVAWPSTGDGGGHASHNTAFTIDEYSCQSNGSCHPDNRGQHSVVGDGKVVVKMAPNYASPNQIVKYIPDTTNGTGTCANVSCHGGQQTPRFNLASTNPIDVTVATGCVKCHTPEGANGWGVAPGNASQYNAPISGLHRGAPPTSGKNHISDYSCTKCHNAAPSKHFKTAGVTNLDSTAMDTVTVTELVTGAAGVGTFTAGTGTSPNYTTPPTCATPAGTTGCHAEADTAYRNPATSWSRKWSWDAYDTVTPVNQCKNCHGHWGSFSPGVVQPHVTSNSDLTLRSTLINSHSENGNDCATMCHAQTNGAYNHGAAVGAAKDMTVNSNAGFVDNGTLTVGCNFCHANEGNAAAVDGAGGTHVFADATWVTAQSIAGPTPNCANDVAGCHGNTAGNKYWPDGTVTYPDKAGEHDMHMTRLAAKLYTENLAQLVTNTGNGTADAKQKAICVYCHNTLSPGLAGHTSDATANQAEVSSFKRIWDGAADTATAGTFATADGSCSNVDCHNNKATTTTYGWRAGATSACLMCHNNDGSGTNNPTTGLHFGTLTVSANTHDDSFKAFKAEVTPTAGCVSCHTTTPSTLHINGTFNNSPAAVAAIINFAPTVGFVDNATAPTCTPNGALATCHTDGGTWNRKWSTTAKTNSGVTGGPECDNCHGGFTGTDWTFGSDNAVGDFNVSHARDWDGATANEIYGNHSNNTAYTNKCNICHVYGDAPYNTAPNFAIYHNNGKITMNTMAGSNTYSGTLFNCTNTCHDNNTNHNLEASSSVAWTTRGESIAGPALSCTGCHGGATPKAGVSSTSPHVTRGRMTGYNTFNACTDCHPGGTKGLQHQKNAHANVILVPNDTTMGINYVSGTNGYSGDNGMLLGGDATGAVTTEAEICWGCHTNDTYNLSVTKTTIAFVDGGTGNDTITDSGNGLAGFAVGKMVTVSGSGQAANNTTFPIVAVAAGAISVPPGSLTAVAAGASITLRERISEWGMNTDTNGAASNYNFGSIYTSAAGTSAATSWATTTSVATNTTYWISSVRANGAGNPNFSYKTGRTQSTHAASSSGVSGLDAVANIRCSYCHDVHNTKAGSPSGAPYLRGTWMGNPYREDGAPQAGQTYATSATNHGSVPRATTATTTLGGYQIDQNNSNPTTGGVAAHTVAANATWSLANNAGLCIMCHTEGVDNLNKFGTAANAWMGANGHSNAAIGGTGANKVNIFRMSGADATYTSVVGRFASAATPADYTGSGSHRGMPRISYLNAGAINDTTVLGDSAGSDQRGYGFRSQDGGGYMFTPQVTTGSPYAYNGYNWGAHADDSAAQTQYHKFSCSKCHNPHASRLPRLMISNCLNTVQNTWDDALSTISGTGVSTENASAKISQLTSAQNCHRLNNTAQGAGARGAGWNKVTPWTTEGTQTNGVIP